MTDELPGLDGETDPIRVLLVDDEPDLADLAATMLAREDDRIEVRTATDAADGLDLLLEGDVDCVVSDYDMPGRNGIEFLEAVREDHPDLPFILFTGKGSEEVASDAISAGVSDYLQKESGTDQYAILANRIRNYVERERAKREHEAIRERMRLALEKTNSIVFEIELDAGAVTRHGHFERLFDLPRDDVPTWETFLEEVVHPADREAFDRFYRRLRDGERTSGTLEYRTNPEFGSVRWIRDAVRVDETEPSQVLGLAQDVTARKEQEREQERIIDRVTDAIVAVDADWTFTFVNDQAEEIYGMDEEYLLGRNFWDVFAEAKGTRFEEEYRRVMRTREPTSLVEYFSQLDGWFDVEAYPNDDGGIAFYFVDVTERHERRQGLERTNSLLSTLFDSLPQGIIAEDESRRILKVNQQIADLFEMPYSPEELAASDPERIAEQIGDALVDPEEFVERSCELVENREPTGGEEVTLRNGSTIERSYLPLELPDGDGHLWVYRDVTERKERSRKLREEQQFVKSIFNALPDPLYALDTNGYPIRWNRRLETVTGYTADEISEMHVSEFVPADDADDVAARVRTILEERRPGTIESALVTKVGDPVPFEFTGAPLEDVDGSLRGLTGVGRDVHERKEHADRLISLNELNQDLMAAVTRERIVEIGVDAAHEIIGLEMSAIHLYDEDRSGLVPVAATDAVYDLIGEPPTFAEGDAIAWRAYERGEAVAIDDVHDDPDRYNPDSPVRSELYLPLGEHGILLAGSPTPNTFDREDLVLGRIWAANVATALDQVARTEQLRNRERKLTRQNERLEEFASVVSHDLRNPLNVAEGRLELAREEHANEHHDAIRAALERMERIIEDMLVLAREGRDIGATEPVDLDEAIADAWAMVVVDEGEAAIDDGGEGLGRIDADHDRLHQLLENLFRNAVEHGGEDVTVSVGRLDDGFYVEDDGPGIPSDVRDEAFDAGYSTAQDSTGFGLSIVRRIVEAHDWSVRVTDGSTGGARFEITGIEFVDR